MNSITDIQVSKNHMVFLINSMGEGGAQRILLSLIEKYLKENMKITLISLVKNEFYDVPMAVNQVYLSKSLNGERGRFCETLLMPYYAWKLKKYVRKENISIIQSHVFRANFVNLISKFFTAKHRIQIVNHSVVSRFFVEGFSGKINLFLIRLLYPNADQIFYISKRMKEDFIRHVKNIDQGEQVIYNPYDIKKVLQEINNDNNNFIFDTSKDYLITVGRLISLKRFEDILSVLSTLDVDIELIMLGNGVERENLEALTKKLGLSSRVHFMGQVKNPYFYMARSKVLILSSHTEGFPNVLIEAMICKTSIISTDCISGPREILAPSTKHTSQLSNGLEKAEFGLLYAVGDKEALIKGIELLLKDNRLREDYEHRAFERCKDFSIEKIAKIYKEAYFK